ncbi:hypothetical protein C1H46_017115 [Malus baccata]|uniref:Tryptophan synthase beta chain-like PALP domain-containing protein n=1 Tax=Malus baccata TaxID=106549 RepID=A0A540MEX5_MALBA|nr:hypothetical protein C1H46_017115 [Malus baccata]
MRLFCVIGNQNDAASASQPGLCQFAPVHARLLEALPDRSATDGNDNRNIVYDVAIESPLELATKLSKRLGVNMWMKRKDLQPVFSFKLHGAYNMVARLPREQLDRGFICSSAENHAQGVALATKNLNCSAVITMPVTTPEIKWKLVERLGAMVVLIGDSYTMRLKLMVKIIGVEPFDANEMALSLHHGDMFKERRGILKPAGALSLANAEAYCKYDGLVEK